MDKNKFMEKLEYLLSDIPEEDKEDAIAYYRDYLEEAGEHADKAIEEFGSPERIASIIRSDLAGNLENGGAFTERGYEDERFRDPNYQIAKRFDLPETKEMEDDKIICGYPALINWDNTSHEKVTALIEVNVTPQRDMGFNKVAERIYKFEEVESVYLMSGGFDLTVIIQGKSMKEVARFVSEKLSTLEYVNSTATYFVLKKYKEHGITMEEEHDGKERMLVTP